MERLTQVGERVWNLERQFNLAAGLTKADDTLPRRLLDTPAPSGTAKGRVNELDVMLPEYYEARGWTPDGEPTTQTLAASGVGRPLSGRDRGRRHRIGDRPQSTEYPGDEIDTRSGGGKCITLSSEPVPPGSSRRRLFGAPTPPPGSRSSGTSRRSPIRGWRFPTCWPRTSRRKVPTFVTENATTNAAVSRCRQDGCRGVDPAGRTVTPRRWRHATLRPVAGGIRIHTPCAPPIEGADLARIENCWTLADARRIMAKAQAGSRVVLMGAGFIGCIVLEALVSRGVKLTVVELADRMLARMMDDTGADMIKRWCEGKGVRVLTSTRVAGLADEGSQVRLNLDGAPSITADLVVCATGVAPNVDFLEGSGVAIGDGVLVDDRLRTNVDGIYAAGDVAQGPAFPTGAKEVHAIQPTASEHGRIAARNMAGHDTPYRGSLSMNVLNTLGLVSSSFGVWMGVEGGERAAVSDPERFKYLRLEFEEDRVVGALAIGLTQHVGVIRGLVQTQVPLGAWKEGPAPGPPPGDGRLSRLHAGEHGLIPCRVADIEDTREDSRAARLLPSSRAASATAP